MVKDIPVQEARSVASSAASDSEDRASDSPPSKRKKAEKATQIQTACMYCRGSKMKCIRNTEEEDCKRCIAASIRCETQARRSGRRPGQGTKRVFPRVERPDLSQQGRLNSSAQVNTSGQSTSTGALVLPLSSHNSHIPVAQHFDGNFQTNQPSYSDMQNTLQERMSYEQQQSYLLPELAEPTHHHVHFSNSQAEAGAQTHPLNATQLLFNENSGQGTHSGKTAPMNALNGALAPSNEYGIASYAPSTSFNTSFPLPVQNATHIPNNLFLPSFAALTADAHSSQLPPASYSSNQGNSAENTSYAFANLLQGSNNHSDGTQQSSGWTPFSNGSASHGQENGHGSLTITPLDMLAAVGMKNSKITPAGSSAPRGAAVQTKAPDKSAVRGCNAYASRSHLAKITTQSDYFSTAHHLVDLDWLPDHDPIGLSLVTETEAREIIDYYFRHCNPLNPLLDPEYHGYDRLCFTSTFLLTAVLATGAKFMEQYGAAAQRLDHHLRKTLIPNAIMEGNSSLELVEGFMVLAPYSDAGRHLTLELTGTYLAIAHDRFKRLPRSRPGTQREAALYRRSYERLHLIIFAYERGFALISGQTLGYLIPEPELASSLLQWARQDGATPADWDMGALCALRHAIPDILRIIAPKRNAEKDHGAAKMASPAIIKAVTAEMLSDWRATWYEGITARAYLTIVEGHTALSLWINALRGHVGQPSETAILQQALLAAIQTLQAAVGADELSFRFLVNNTFVMVAYAAAFTLRLLARWTETSAPVESSISVLIGQVADRLQAAGRTPAHRYGRSWLYGQRLHEMLKDRMSSRRPSRASSPFHSANVSDGIAMQNQQISSSRQAQGAVASIPLAAAENSSKTGEHVSLEEEYDIANMSPDKVDKLLSEYTWFPLENAGNGTEFLDWDAFFAG